MARPHDTMMNPAIESLLDRSDSKFTLVTLAAKRARQINSYFNQLGDGLGAIVPAAGRVGVAQAALDRLRGDLGRQDHLRASRARRRRRRGRRRRPGRCPEPIAEARPTRKQPSRPMAGLTGRRIVLGVTGGIAAYKAVEVCRRLVDLGAHVVPIMTRDAHRFVGETTFSALASEPVHTSLWDDGDPIPHTRLGQAADLVVVAPATARFLAAYAAGLSGDLLTAVVIATRAPVVVCPAMHTEMWEHASVQENLATLRRRGVHVVEPESRPARRRRHRLGPAREPRDRSSSASQRVLAPQDMAGLRVLVTAGGTREPIDAVRVIANRSSGKQGHALAFEAAARGASVTVVTTVPRAVPAGAEVVVGRDGGRDGSRGDGAGGDGRRRRHGRRGRRLPAEGRGRPQDQEGRRAARDHPRADARHPRRASAPRNVRADPRRLRGRDRGPPGERREASSAASTSISSSPTTSPLPGPGSSTTPTRS